MDGKSCGFRESCVRHGRRASQKMNETKKVQKRGKEKKAPRELFLSMTPETEVLAWRLRVIYDEDCGVRNKRC